MLIQNPRFNNIPRPRPGVQQPRPGMQPGVTPFVMPGVQPLPSPIIDVGPQVGGPRPGIPFQGFPIPRGPIQQYQPGTTGGGKPLQQYQPGTQQPQSQQPLSNIQNILSGGTGGPRPLQGATPLGPMQGVGDPRLGAPMIPGNRAQMMMRGPQQAPMQQFSYGGRAGYQMGGIGTLPMDYGQSLQVPSQQQPMFTSTGNATSSPVLNYGQTEVGKAGGTPLTRNGYQEGGLSDFYKAEEPIIPRIENIGGLLDQAEKSVGQPTNNFNSPLANTFSRFGMQEGGMGMDQEPMMQPQQMDPRQALELIIQMLIAQGIPPEQAKEIAIQMVQAVAEGGMGEMSDERVEARFGGRIGYAGGGLTSIDRARDMLQSRAPSGEFLAYINPQEAGILKLMGGAGQDVNVRGVPSFFFKSVFKAAKGVVKGVTGAIKKVVGSDLGKIALTVAALYAGGGGFSPQGFSFFGSQAGPGLLGSGGAFDLGSSYLGQGLFGAPTAFAPGTSELSSLGSKGLLGNLGITSGYGADLLSGGVSSLLPGKGTLAAFGLGTTLGGFLGGPPKPEDFPNNEEYQKAVDKYKEQFQTAINNPNPQFAAGQFPNNPFYPQRAAMAANGGRIGYQEGGIGNLIKQVTQQEFFGTPMMANGGRMGYAMGAEVPTRENQAGVTELDYREKGGFVPPIGIKERADDIPAMLSNNEFVFTADAVRNAGNGNVNKGAQRMYTLMKQLEAGGVV